MEYLTPLAQHGLLGLLLVLSLLTNGFLYREIRAETNKRFIDYEQNRESTKVLIESLQKSVDLILVLLQSSGGRKR